jgi:hypothetical protein
MKAFFYMCLRVTIFSMLLSAFSQASAFTLSNGEEVVCPVTRNGVSGFATEVWNTYATPSDRNPELGKAVAVMRLDANDWPTIIIDAQAYQRTAKGTPAQWDFVYFHECAHAQKPDLSEIGANCAAYFEMDSRGLMGFYSFKELESAHMGMMNLPKEYGGSGPQFWHQTLQCVRKGREENLK